MGASEKMHAFGMKALAEKVGHDLVTVYRWRKQLIDGRGVRDDAKRKLIGATEGTPHAIAWEDFAPGRQVA